MGSRPIVGANVVVAALVVVVVVAVAGAPRAAAQEPIVRASISTAGVQGNGESENIMTRTISNDGQSVVFGSSATNLVPNDTNGLVDVFVRDLSTGVTTLVSVSNAGLQADFDCGEPTISGNGRFVVFDSFADNLVASDTNQDEDVFLYDRDPDGNGVFDEGNGTLEIASVDANGVQGNGASYEGTLSDDGDVVVFLSRATNLVSNDKNGKTDVFVRVRSTSTVGRADVDDHKNEANGDAEYPEVSADGTHVVFMSMATNLTSQPDGQAWDVFVRDRVAKTTRRASETSTGVQANSQSDTPAISSDGQYVVFRSQATNLWPNDDPSGTTADVFLKDMTTGSTTCMTVDSNGVAGHAADWCSMSSDGSKVLFMSGSTVFVPNDTNAAYDVFVRDVATNGVVCASVNCTGIPANAASQRGSLSSDGRYATFWSSATDLVDGDTNGVQDVFVNDLSNPGFQAYWQNYGVGWPGTHGVPTLVSSADPEFGATIDVLASNSWGNWAVGFLLLGLSEDSIPTSLGGTILLDLASLEVVVVPPHGFDESYDIPYDPSLCGLEADFQMLEIDPGASKGVSFTPGLALFVGR